ncbi:hypothetical protein pdam_00009897 [Pocillopora damicornis]|uniref:Uncharacterized protein n=1 Tax=Pocillopora damicornis TaxID=46731 RepID=A0A3M6THC6_POCDA|nr:hypothetical protein pdam_00009897 [Pocillopora damicornis]
MAANEVPLKMPFLPAQSASQVIPLASGISEAGTAFTLKTVGIDTTVAYTQTTIRSKLGFLFDFKFANGWTMF